MCLCLTVGLLSGAQEQGFKSVPKPCQPFGNDKKEF